MPTLLYDLLTKPEIATPHLVGRGILPVKGKLVLGGNPKSNKSWIAMNLAIGLARGRAPFDALYHVDKEIFPVYAQSTVLYIEQEMGESGVQDRFKIGLLSPERSLGLPIYFQTRDVRFRLDTPDGQQLIEEAVASCRPKVTFLDPLAKLHGANEDSSQEMGRVLRFGDYLVEKYETALVYIHHTAKPSFENPRRGGDRLRGSSAVFADADTIVLVDRKSGEDELEPTLELSFELRRGEPLPKQYLKRLKTGQVVYLGQGSEGRAASNRT
jgi:RecA-family ATPase